MALPALPGPTATPILLMTLPNEILLQICSVLEESSASSLAEFSLANKRCHAVAASCQASTIAFRIQDPARLSRDVEKCKQFLQRHQLDLFQSVRRLVIVGRIIDFGGLNPADNMWETAPDAEGKDGEVSFSLPKTTAPYIARIQLHGIQFGSHGPGAIWPDYRSPLWSDHAPASAAYDTDHLWRPLADLISQLPGLTDVIFRCSSQFPPCLLKAMHGITNPNRNPTRPRLHLQAFNLRSADDGSTTIDSHEWEIITSPCLYSIWLCRNMNWGEENNFQQVGAVKWMVKQGLFSSCLREVKVLEGHALPPSWTNPRPIPRPLNPITFFNQEQRTGRCVISSEKGHLTHLKIILKYGRTNQLGGLSVLGLRSNEAWDNLIDFSLLRTLDLVEPISQEQLVYLGKTRLDELTTLSLACELPVTGGGPRLNYFQTIAGFLSGLPSLTALEVTEWDHASLVFTFRNPRLEKLSFLPIVIPPNKTRSYLTLGGLTVLVSSFPRLTDLSIQLKRSRGDSAEVALYRRIGERLPNLRRLSLLLDCSLPPHLIRIGRPNNTPLCKSYPSGPGWPAVAAFLNGDRDIYAPQKCRMGRYRNGHIYDIFINSALDATLAREIFAAVGGNVEVLLVQTYRGDDFTRVEQDDPDEEEDYAGEGDDDGVIDYHGEEDHDGEEDSDEEEVPDVWRAGRGAPLGARLHPFLAAIGKPWMVEKANNIVTIKEMDVNKFGRRLDSVEIRDRHLALLQCFRQVWPGKKEGSMGWFEDWESWKLHAE